MNAQITQSRPCPLPQYAFALKSQHGRIVKTQGLNLSEEVYSVLLQQLGFVMNWGSVQANHWPRHRRVAARNRLIDQIVPSLQHDSTDAASVELTVNEASSLAPQRRFSSAADLD